MAYVLRAQKRKNVKSANIPEEGKNGAVHLPRGGTRRAG